MSIKLKLILHYFTLIGFTIILLFVFLGIVSGNFSERYQKINSSPKDLHTYLTKVSNTIETEPHLFTDKDYIRNIDNELIKKFDMSIAVKTNENEYLYISPYLNSKEFEEFLNNLAPNEDLVFIRDTTFAIKQYAINNTSNIVYIISDAEKLALRSSMYQKGFFKSRIAIMFIIFISIFIAIISTLSFWVSRSILKPLGLLKKAAEEIAQGNLDYKVVNNSKDEFQEAFGAFDNMRINLKSSLELQKQYEENRKELIANISHDLQTPITSIKCHIEGIIDNIANTPEKRTKYLQIVSSQANYMSSLIDDLFMVSKLDLKKISFELKKIDLKVFFEDCIDEIEDEYKANNISLQLYFDRTLSYNVMADTNKLKRAVINILDNSKKYMDKQNGLITIKLNIIESFVNVQIEDNGKGIAEDDLKMVFDRFYRSDKARSTSIRGSGLGLEITKLIILEHNGNIRAESTLDAGTKIIFNLPK
jgi:histidine kinase